MTSVVTVMNMKGGVGKTVLTAHLGGMLARYELGADKYRRVLMIDYDPQFNLSQSFIPAKTYFDLEKRRATSLAILQDNETASDPFKLRVPGNHDAPALQDVVHHLLPKSSTRVLDIVPSTLDLMYVALGQLPNTTKVFEERFTKFIKAAREAYDVVLIDCHPAGSLLTKTALTNSDHVIIPVVPDSPFAARGVGLMKRFINDLGARKPTPHVIFNMGSPASEHANKIRTDPRHAPSCFVAALQKRKAFSDPSEGVGFVWESKRPYSTIAFRNLLEVALELVQRLSV